MPRPLPDLDLRLLREAAEADFHATPATVLALLDIIEAQHQAIDALLGPGERAPELYLVQPWVAPWRQPAATVEQPSLFGEP